MDENKQIEEIKNILLASTPVIDMPFECFGAVAKAIYSAGYRKTDKVIDRLMNAETSSGLTEKEIEFFVKHNEKVRKETVREFVSKIDEEIQHRTIVNDCAPDFDEMQDIIYQTAKEYGVEI